MKNITVRDIAEITNGKILCGSADTVISSIQYDSREIKSGSLFVPIRGARVDGHRFIEDCLASGAEASLTENSAPENALKPYIRVDNTLKALQALAERYRRQFSVKLIGITGSVGKTSTKEMIAAELSNGFDVMKTQGNKNSQIGLPMTMFDIEEHNEISVIEMGMSEFGEMDRLCDIARPNIAVMTNIGTAHIENLKTQENIMAEKLKITKHFDKDGLLFINGDDRLLKTLHKKQQFKTVTFGIGGDCDYRAENMTTHDFCTDFVVCRNGQKDEFTIPALGIHNVSNALAAIAVGEALGLEKSVIQSGLMTYKNAPMRQQIYKMKNYTLIDDSYNSSPEAARVSLDVLKSVSGGKTIAVLADMLELGEKAEAEHYKIGEYLAKIGTDSLITIGELSKNTADGALKNGVRDVKSFDTNDEAYEYLLSIIQKGCTVLVKGSRGMRTDRISQRLIKNEKEL